MTPTEPKKSDEEQPESDTNQSSGEGIAETAQRPDDE